MTLTFIHVLKTGFSVSMLVATIMKEWKLKFLKKNFNWRRSNIHIRLLRS